LRKIFFYFERVLFSPKIYDFPIIFLLLPFSIVFFGFTFLNALRKHLIAKKFPIKIIGVGNLVLGGTGKTPITISLAKNVDEVAIVLRGYGRKSKGTILISEWGKILENVETSGDEAMLYAKSLQNASVIVSENRENGIQKAISLGAKTVFLDDSYRQHQIYKDIEFIIESNTKNFLPFPAGAYRERLWFFKKNIKILKENIDFKRQVSFSQDKNLVLVTAISKPNRLSKFLPEIPKYFFPDHHNFTQNELAEILEQSGKTKILTTEKDFVKIEKFSFDVEILKLEIIWKREVEI
jgi:tetraacyldisaccharide 4'-kinase